MTTNEILAKHNFITKIMLKNGDESLSKGLIVKVMGARIKYGKVRKQFDEDVQEFIKGITPEGFTELQQKQDKTDEDNAKLQEMIDQINNSYNEYITNLGKEEIDIADVTFTEDEFNEILGVMAGEDVEINGQVINSADYLEILYSLFVKD